MRILRHALAWMLAALLAACVTAPTVVKPPTLVKPPPAAGNLPAIYRPATFAELPGWSADRADLAWPAFVVGCARLAAMPAVQATWQSVCAAAAAQTAVDAGSARAFFETHFSVWKVTSADGADTGLVTGYYEPLLAGSRVATPRFATPLYAPPDDLLTVDLASLYPELAGKRVRARVEGRKVVPYWTRADIEAGHAPLDGKALVYVDDAVDAFFLEIQGSGRVRLDDGSVVRINYADQNGQPFRSVARVLIDRGELTADRASMQAIRAWGRAHPDVLPELLDENPSYVFFRIVPPPAAGSLEAAIDGPIGSLGVPLARERTIAVDPRSIPLGAPVYVATTRPLSDEPLMRLVLAQDTGGAIRGAVRADFFWGFGADAAREAGRMKQPLKMWLLWPADAGVPRVPSP
ncbi:MAG TPA: murein transglycosylase A [Casimicrobiaceae bacterium]|nr:murein transglycosylase A [Casimicrobiaceae bacterium]